MERARVKWRKEGGGILVLRSGIVIKPGHEFFASPNDIPKAFMDTIRRLTPVTEEKPVVAVRTVYNVQKRETSNFYDIVREDGKIMNTKALKKKDAEEYIKTLEEE